MEAKTASSTLPQWRCTRFAIATCGLILAIIASLQNDLSTSARFSMGDISFISPTRFDNGSTYNSNDDTKKTIAYAVSVTACPSKKQHSLIDGAAVLHQSIRLASRTSKYDYQMLAFVHPEAIECSSMLQQLGYEVQIRDTPFNESLVKNANLVNAQLNTCCGFKEYLKLYSYVQTDYPVVVHLDLDCLVLKPLDDVFDLMLDPTFDRRRIPAMWLAPEDIPKRVDFVFTRDYGMVEPGVREPHQVGIQGGFLVVRPSQSDFDKYIEIILSGGDFTRGYGWGGKSKAYGGYYGAGTIQGLASYYYGEFAKDRAVELNRCYYDQMVDDPYGDKSNDTCRTLEATCQDCRKTPVADIYMAHFANCGKPFWCSNPATWGAEYKLHVNLCMDLFREWHLVRMSLETEWETKYSEYKADYAPIGNTSEPSIDALRNFSLGHCSSKRRYIPMSFPVIGDDEALLPKSAASDSDSVEETANEPIDGDGESPIVDETTLPPTPAPTISTRTMQLFPHQNSNKTKIAYAVSITGCNPREKFVLLDDAAVLHQSIRLASNQSRYGYHMMAFVHHDASECAPYLSKLGYEVQVKETPFNESAISNPELAEAQGNSCCGAKEYLKLYSYLQHDYPVVVHLDLDTIVLKPMDTIFNLMLDDSFDRSLVESMWLAPEQMPSQVDFIFTRDYNMVDPPRRQPHQIGVQGGFLVIRPNASDFDRMVDIILSGGDFEIGSGWGGQKLSYGGYYGAGTIQGLASYYYGEFAKNRSVEVNRCHYNNMVDSPMGPDDTQDGENRDERCRTLEDTCQDCRSMNVSDIYTTHFTVCGKPHFCVLYSRTNLCWKLHHEWHNIRLSLEMQWQNDYPEYNPGFPTPLNENMATFSHGHCKRPGQYVPMIFPEHFEDSEAHEN